MKLGSSSTQSYPQVEYSRTGVISRFEQSGFNKPGDASQKSKAFYEFVKKDYKQHTGEKMNMHLKIAMGHGQTLLKRDALKGLFEGQEGLKEMAKHSLSPTFNRTFNTEMALKDDRPELGHGAFNSVFMCKFRDKEVGFLDRLLGRKQEGTLEVAVKVAKDQQLEGGGNASIQKHTGVMDDPRVADRNVATTILNKVLGTNSVPEAKLGFLDNRPIVAMSIAPGEMAGKAYPKNPDLIQNPDFQRQMSDIEVIAFLSANPDPHMGNIMVDVQREVGPSGEGRGKILKVTATMVDNDMSFGKKMTNPDQPPDFKDRKRADHPGFIVRPSEYRHTGLPAYMDAETCKRIKNLDFGSVDKQMSKNLTSEERGALRERFNLLKEHVKFLEGENRIVQDWKAWTAPGGGAVAGGSFIEGTLGMAGVKQGVLDGESHFAPRSMIMRDYSELDSDTKRRMNALLPADQRQAITDWNENTATLLVPPSLKGSTDIAPPRREAVAEIEDADEPEPVAEIEGADEPEPVKEYSVTPSTRVAEGSGSQARTETHQSPPNSEVETGVGSVGNQTTQLEEQEPAFDLQGEQQQYIRV